MIQKYDNSKDCNEVVKAFVDKIIPNLKTFYFFTGIKLKIFLKQL